MTHTSTEQPEALRLADRMEWYCISQTIDGEMRGAAKELRRLHARVQELEEIESQLCEQADVAANAYRELEASQAQRVSLSPDEIWKWMAERMLKAAKNSEYKNIRNGVALNGELLPLLVEFAEAHGITQEKHG